MLKNVISHNAVEKCDIFRTKNVIFQMGFTHSFQLL